ncbi:MAG: GIY-YIG nuclease family protein [Chloroflexota bacterium]
MNNNTPGGSRNRSWAGVARADRTLSAAALPAAPGTYCLWLQLETPLRIPVGRIGELSLPPGLYAYAGSALGPGGLQARAGRHLRAEKPLRWHIDWLTVRIPVAAIWYRTGRERLECAWAQAILQAPGASIPLRGFGASDCACPAHLFAVPSAALDGLWVALSPDGALSTPD